VVPHFARAACGWLHSPLPPWFRGASDAGGGESPFHDAQPFFLAGYSPDVIVVSVLQKFVNYAHGWHSRLVVLDGGE
jgi:hypothetical protein